MDLHSYYSRTKYVNCCRCRFLRKRKSRLNVNKTIHAEYVARISRVTSIYVHLFVTQMLVSTLSCTVHFLLSREKCCIESDSWKQTKNPILVLAGERLTKVSVVQVQPCDSYLSSDHIYIQIYMCIGLIRVVCSTLVCDGVILPF